MTTDRRKPVARYVLFSDPVAQDRFAAVAEAAFQDLARLDQWAGQVSLELAAEPKVPSRRGLLRRSVAGPGQVETLTVTGALAAAGEAGRDVPARVESIGGCAAERKLSATMGRVVVELVRDLAATPVAEQRAHPAYRQTLRLAAELQALYSLLAAIGCQAPFGCVRPRPPEQWGRRVEDVEITEVRAVLLEIAEDTAAHG
ncbi:hypothetical protein [Nocardioides panacihumi]